jgi:hypothetical protein
LHVITFLFVRTRGVNNAEGGFIISTNFVHELPSATARYGGLAGLVPRSINTKTQRLVQGRSSQPSKCPGSVHVCLNISRVANDGHGKEPCFFLSRRLAATVLQSSTDGHPHDILLI